MLLTGLPALQGDADAAPGPGRRCDEKWLGRTYDTPVAGSGIKGKNQPYSVNPDKERGSYPVDNPAHAFDGLKAPSAAQQKLAGDTTADIEKWKAKYEQSKNTKYRVLEYYARYGNHLRTSGKPTRDFSRYMDRWIIGNEVNRVKGDSFERKIVKDFKLVGPDWICQKEVPVRGKDGKPVVDKDGKPVVRRYDAYNARTREFVEFKSNGKHIARQFGYDRLVLRDPQWRDHSLRLITGEKTTSNTVKQFDALNRQLANERGKPGSTPVTIREQRNTPAPRWRPNQYTRYDKVFNPDPRRAGTLGPINDAAWRSGDTPDQARQVQRQYQGANTRGGLGRGPGGVDFTTLELSYVGNPVKGKALDYSFKADYVKDEEANPGWGGKAKLQLASDAFFTWLALSPDKFWVNLNPDQPDRIMDNAFAKTDAGRTLLEADLAMKHDFAAAINPDKHPSARTFWDNAPRRAGLPCFPETRLWIEPKTAKVREQDGGIYILDAPLKVSAEWMDVEWHPPGARVCDLTDPEKRTSERLLRQHVMPEVEKRVNTSPGYADLRRVYASRVAAEWTRQQDAKKPTDFRSIINSNDASRWPLRGENANWSKHETYERYMKSGREGVEWFKLEYGGQVYNQGVGGVDFSKSPKRNITKTQFTVEKPRLDTTTKTSVHAETSYRDTETAYLGGNGSGPEQGDGNPTPSPTPTPTGTGGPTPTGSGEPTPAPTGTGGPDPTPTGTGGPSSTPTDSGGPTPAPTGTGGTDPTLPPTSGPKDPGGGLADTGSSAPVGLIAGIAAALAAAGAALTWWVRRRRNGGTG